ncbi:MAG: helix-turn-helix-type transcriptional regulator [Salinicola sp.]|uniref:MerR family transcriptional regulator n=1 Tax=Salinicola sp. TaxID=1978524 RepID=UPI000C962D8E|nr:MerR family transcriptional regulator [Salinicola sp.]MAM56762.1 helix-turn-helix-type transcriptional regulator [Salinicola sp.]NRB55724.1 MerR family transcriptional regulator [Salinicola sp.]
MTYKAVDSSAAPLYPIREVSRLTGVNSVTLRAWERRYGLIRPQRTPKGHRLYGRNDIERVERILQWLNRGVPVSQVRELLDQPETVETPAPQMGDWASQRQHVIQAVEALDTGRLEALFNQSLSLYPVGLCIAELWQPVISQLEERWGDQFGATLQRRVLESFLRTRIGTRIYHANQLSNAGTVLVASLPDDSSGFWSLLMGLAASASDYRVQLIDGEVPLSEFPLAVERLGTQALLLASGHAERSDVIRRQLPRLAEQCEAPVCLVGPVARIRASDLENTAVAVLGEDMSQALSRMRAMIDAGI